ncbi:hypothetical protein [Streptomyces hirsutus]|uniref:hypothetical protein n=1 Tax=Streptomyces hirsutus TaxID=35620 RepID=UPI0036887521
MANRKIWLKVLTVIAEGGGEALRTPCPDCGQFQLELRYIVDAESRIGHALFWCNECLHGVTVSRVRAPKGIPTYTFGEPAAMEGVPNLIRHE